MAKSNVKLQSEEYGGINDGQDQSDEEGQEMSTDDIRLEFIQDYVMSALKVKMDKWKKAMSTDENRKLIQQFLDEPSILLLIFSAPVGGAVAITREFKEAMKHKSIYLMRRRAVPITRDNFRNVLVAGDMSSTTFSHLTSFVHEIAFSLLGNQRNHVTWPGVVSDDIGRHVNALIGKVDVSEGLVSGKTVLPMPVESRQMMETEEEEEEVDPEVGGRSSSASHSRPTSSVSENATYNKLYSSHRPLIHAIESTVIEWAHQVQGVVQHDSSEALLAGKNPWPSEEVKFWKVKAGNLQFISDQLGNPKIAKMARLLQTSGSSYWPTLKKIFEDVSRSLAEARDITTHLQALKGLVENMEQGNFPDVKPLLSASMHVIELIWKHSRYYCIAPRVIVLLQEISNMLIDQARTYIAADEIFKGEIEDSHDRIVVAIDVFKHFRSVYERSKRRIYENAKSQRNGGVEKTWDFPTTMAFARADVFLARLKDIKNLFDTCLEMTKLEKLEFGGMKGRGLSEQVVSLHQEFSEHWKVFTESTYDSLDQTNEEFFTDYTEYLRKVEELDYRVSTIILQAFNDCSGIEGMFKLLAILGPLRSRPIIRAETGHMFVTLLDEFDKELDRSKILFDSYIKNDDSDHSKNMPPVSGAIQRVSQLRRRIEGPKEQFRFFKHPILQSDESQRVFAKYDEMIKLLKSYEDGTYNKWQSIADDICNFNLDQPLIERDRHTNLVSVNFSPQLASVLREVKYLSSLGVDSIPANAAAIYEKNETLWKFHANLEITSVLYNKIRDTVLEVEYPLIADQLDQIDDLLKDAEDGTRTWSGEETWDYIRTCRNKVTDLESRVQRAKDNVNMIHNIMDKWSEIPLYTRKEDKKDVLLMLDEREERLSKRYVSIHEDAQEIHKLIKENITHFQADSSSVSWQRYLEYVDGAIVDGLASAIQCSLRYLVQNTDNSLRPPPLLECKLLLNTPDVVFQPPLDYEMTDGFYDLVESIITEIYGLSTLVERVASHLDFPHYVEDMEQMLDLANMRSEIMDRTQGVTESAVEFKATFDKYAYLWVDDRKEFMRQFLLYDHVLTTEEIEEHAEHGVPESPPTLDQFRMQIDSYEALFDEVSKLTEYKVFSSWFRVDIRPFQQALLNIIKRWSYMFKDYLMTHVIESLQELEDFIETTDNGLQLEVKEGDYDALVKVMANLVAVRERQQATDGMFEPLKSTIDLLLTYDQELPEESHAQLEALPEKWESTKKQATTIRHNVSPLQANEVTVIRKRCVAFDVKQHEFREAFRKRAPFLYTSEQPYVTLDQMERETCKMELEMLEIKTSAELFEVNLPEFKQLKACRRDLRNLKSLWDMIILVRTSLDDWTLTCWRKINVDDMDMELRRFLKEIRTLDKESRAWDAFSGLDSMVKNMITSLRAVVELQSPAIRDRHWQQLMTATGVRFEMGDDTTLADLLALQLHRVEDEVKNIVDKAKKEMGIEKVLQEMRVTWSTVEFEYERHHATGTAILVSNEELIETLEDNQVQLQNMLTSKFVEYFREEVSDWQKKLVTADTVIQAWLEVQRTWSHLESIFIGSEDIRSQLPEDTVRFASIDEDFKELMEESERLSNVIESTNRPGLFDKLEGLLERLSVCEKSLAEYLEKKRLMFPRFYFVSSADLLDILSKGTQPTKVTRHLRKLFDNINDLKFKLDEDGEPTKTALGMYSKEEEYVDFDEPCELVGQVEVWLNRLKDTQRSTVRHQIQESVVAYEEKARDQWLFDYPAQVALAGSQIWWTTEVGIAFEKLEEGFENAMKDYNKKQVTQLNTLISHLLGDLNPLDRQNIMTICTIDVHNRDVVGKLITEKVTSSQAFTWLSQLRHRWDEDLRQCFANICNAQFLYQYEYLGNTSRLVITPLTDRCYITLTQSLNLTMSGAPAGPAGTGKTETTKDLGRALGILVFVFNCSEQMDYKSIGNIYKGLSQTGAWGCFDEFNRIAIEVLSVVAVQVKMIQDALKAKKDRFMFLGDDIKLCPSVGIFITMNPGYAGRTELPENLKALFRPCAMVVPDIAMICENMLVAEGFTEARLLARKFITLYDLCKELCSKQYHYDWGLRAVKSVLVVAGALRRADKQRPEEQVLMRALRDFNLPKIVTEDVPIFMGLITDLFPLLNVPRIRDEAFEKRIKQTVARLKLQPEENFILKVVQLEELLAVRHSVFVIGNAGAGKSQILKTLHETHKGAGKKAVWNDLNPKALTTDELFGFIHPATREWKDGLFSSTMRDQSNISHNDPKWIVLDGDIDPMWIESLNTVMDDNRMLTLASNERIPLTNSMRLLFEIYHLRSATPATVSRAGILYVNPQDLGWNPPVTSWIDTRSIQSERANLTILFDKYVPTCLEAMRSQFKTITPVPDNTMIQMLCYLLECLITPEAVPADSPRELYELYFVFAAVWAFGGATMQDQLTDHRVEFSRWWVKEFKHIKFPSSGTVFDFCIDASTRKFVPWSERVAKFEMDPDVPIQSILVHTMETTRIRYFVDLLIERGRPVMLVGNAGCGKSLLVSDTLRRLTDNHIVASVPFNYYTTPAMLQRLLEKHLEKKAGRNYGPVGNKKLIYFLDDVNMPEVDTYGTVGPHTLIRQHIDYGHWYDRNKLALKDIHSTQYVACMNPTAGSFTINPRLQRHFCVFAVNFPSTEALESIYSSILGWHFSGGSGYAFPPNVSKNVDSVVRAAVHLHQRVTATFLPTAIKFHYIFNLRDLSNVFQGLLFATPECLKSQIDVIRLWLHESARVYGDKMVEVKDSAAFDKLLADSMRRVFEGNDEFHDRLLAKPNIFCHFSEGIGEPKYMPVKKWDSLQHTLEEALESHNEVLPVMDLVLFEDAIMHICRINRILESPRGNALLVGVGGSGKQSLSRLAAYISGLDVFQLTLKKGYSMQDLKSDLVNLYTRTGVKCIGTVFLMTDAHVPDERFLVLINDHLAMGEISDLFTEEETEDIINGVRNEVRAQGLFDSRENCWKFFLDRVRNQLKIVLCFSPVGSTLRVRARKFPALVNCCSIDWFHGWPHEALVSVSRRFVSEIEEISLTEEESKVEEEDTVIDSIAKFMAFAHESVNEVGLQYKHNERRFNYTTPKSFLEQIDLYKHLIKHTTTELNMKMDRLENGLLKLQNTSEQVDDLKAKLAAQEVELKSRSETTEKLLSNVGQQTEKVGSEKEVADEEEKKVAVKATAVAETQQQCEEELVKAEPALLAATEALNTLNRNNLMELKSFATPPPAVSNVTAAVMCLCAPDGKIPKDKTWRASKAFMGRVEQFLDSLINYDKEHIHENCLKATRQYMDDPDFNPDNIRTKSFAAAGLCAWVINIVRWYDVYCDVEPKRQALAAANHELASAQTKLSAIRSKISGLDHDLGELTKQFEEATAEKIRCSNEVANTAKTITLANRLVKGLQSEKVRWSASVRSLQTKKETLSGDVLLTAAFVSYLGYFTKSYRLELLNKQWLPFLNRQKFKIPLTEGLDPIDLLVDDATIASWNNESLPSDRMSSENAAILSQCKRWPLIVDPQLQGVKWIKGHFGEDLKTVQMGHKGYLDVIERSVSEGGKVLIENISESIDPVLQPLLGRNTIKKGKYIKIGEKEVEYHPEFKLILQTKLANPHYKPEMQAQTTLINFTVTRDGLEDQLLANVVSMERPDLEQLKVDLTKQQNDFKITLKKLEDNLLSRLSAAEGNFLGDTELVENLEHTKRTSEEIEVKVVEAKQNEIKINEAREHYRSVAARASLLYFILNDLHKINPIYQFSLKAFKGVFIRSIELTEKFDDVDERVRCLIDSVTYETFAYTSRGLFEKDKLIFTSLVAFQVLQMRGDIDSKDLEILLRFPTSQPMTSPVDFLTNQAWGVIKAMSLLDEFLNLDRDIEGSPKRWKKLVDSEAPEKEKLPQEWKNKPIIQQLCILRTLRPDRMTYALRGFIEVQLGGKYVENRAIEIKKTFDESSQSIPIFFVLSPGVDPLKNVEALGKKLGYSNEEKNFHSVSLGQGQEVVAEEALGVAAEHGHWVILQNVHLVAKWLPRLDHLMETNAETAHPDYRVFISAEPPPTPDMHVIPQGILENAIKITNEPPTGMLANLHSALDNFTQDTLEMCVRESEFKSILFSLCYFHSAVAERRKFGPQGWNRSYPFNTGDLTISVNVLYNYLEVNPKVPWTDLRYLFGEIMYGGHITDDWDRRLCKTYLEVYMDQEQLDSELFLSPGFPVPPNLHYKGYHQYVDEMLPPESPVLYGLHPNAEVGILTVTSDHLFRTVLELQPREGSHGGDRGSSMEEMVKSSLDDILEKLPEEFAMAEITAKTLERTPYILVCFQECERMNNLIREIRRSLKELDLGLKGELTISAEMEQIQNALFLDKVPTSWSKISYPSLYSLGLWYSDVLVRCRELDTWTHDLILPAVVWLGGLFNPQSFLTAVMQSMARKNEWPLDKMVLSVDVTKKSKDDFSHPPREGAYVHGLFLEGAKWDTQTGFLAEARLKELTAPVPVVFVKAIPVDRQETKNIYECPLYRTRERGPTFIWTFNLKSKENRSKWILAGVALLLSV
uniref:dynein beta chain, ciliary n=1 Tax=Ciona intestinalis TaxID=7719 RepID=UPI00089DC381|nr:dynein beta chain, ciliary [Ciona intestinalis]|eukprot:XP_018673081.1 dynein beta chain, ciliary [Ciona intestinalis]